MCACVPAQFEVYPQPPRCRYIESVINLPQQPLKAKGGQHEQLPYPNPQPGTCNLTLAVAGGDGMECTHCHGMEPKLGDAPSTRPRLLSISIEKTTSRGTCIYANHQTTMETRQQIWGTKPNKTVSPSPNFFPSQSLTSYTLPSPTLLYLEPTLPSPPLLYLEPTFPITPLLYLEPTFPINPLLYLEPTFPCSLTLFRAHLLHAVHDHLPVLFIVIFEVVDKATDNLGPAHFVSNLHRCIHQL